MNWLEIGRFRLEKWFESRKDNDNDNPMKTFKSPPPQNPMYHKMNDIIPIKAVKAIENSRINESSNNMLKIRLKAIP